MRGEPEPHSLSGLVVPPWTSVSRSAWRGPSYDAARLFKGDVVAQIEANQILVPAHVALLWELRSDLQVHFTLDSVDDVYCFLAWAMTHGTEEGLVHCAEFSPQFLRQMAEEWAASRNYGDVPITAGLAATRFIATDNKHYDCRQRFPEEHSGRLAHGLWFAYLAAKQFDWPQRLVAPQRRYFEAPSRIVVDGLRLPNAVWAIWCLRGDVQKAFPLDSGASVRNYLVWLLTFGLRELGITLDQLGSELSNWLLSGSPRFQGLERFLEMIYEVRRDLQLSFDLTSEAGLQAVQAWWWNPASQDEQAAITLFNRSEVAPYEPDVPVFRAKVALTGQWTAPTGRGEDLRCSVTCLQTVGFTDFVIVDSESEQILRHDGPVLAKGCRVEVEVNILHLNADTAYADWRLMRKLRVSAKKSVGFWAWELERLPSNWRHAFSFVDEIWASSRFAAAAFSYEHLRPVCRMPMAVIVPEPKREIGRRELGLPADATVFLFVFHFESFVSRKNPGAVVRAFLQAFPRGDEEAYLLIKTMGAGDNGDRLEQLRKACCDPRISLRDIKLARDDLVSLIKASDAFVSLHRSEGFGRLPAEAMLLGRPTILTAYSGTNDFATSECACLVDYKLVPVLAGEYIGVENQNWADPNVATAARHMRRIYERPRDAKRIGRLGTAQIKRLFEPSFIGKMMHDRITGLLSSKASTPTRRRGPKLSRV